jgi:hypothetical protein
MNRLAYTGLFIPLCTVALLAADDKYTRPSLSGLRAVQVVVEAFSASSQPLLEARGLTVNAIQTDAELRLRKAGIRVLTREERLKTPGAPYLYLNAIITTGSSLWGNSLAVSIVQDVSLGRDQSIQIQAATWSVESGGGIILPERIAQRVRDGFNDMVDQFINAYLSVNQR